MTADTSAALAAAREARRAFAAHETIGHSVLALAHHIEALAAANAELEARLAEANDIIRFYGFCAEEDEDGGERARLHLHLRARASAGEKDKTP